LTSALRGQKIDTNTERFGAGVAYEFSFGMKMRLARSLRKLESEAHARGLSEFDAIEEVYRRGISYAESVCPGTDLRNLVVSLRERRLVKVMNPNDALHRKRRQSVGESDDSQHNARSVH
jgi:hypothetical protein